MKLFRNYIMKILEILILIFLSLFCFGQSPSELLFDMSDFEIKHVGFNTRASDFGPSFVNDDLWFSAYTNPNVRKALSGKQENIFYSLFKTPVDSRGFTTYEPRILIDDLKSGFHEGPVSYCEKTGELFVTLSNSINFEVEEEGILVKKEKIKLRLVICKKVNELWTIQNELPFNDPVYSVGHPSISPSGDTLFFTSDNPSLSKGGTDIFMVIRKDSIWGQPLVLGKNINTTGNEMFPFYHPSGMLIFASNSRPEGKGGLDLYVSDLLPEGFTPAKPLSPFNSPYDDFGLVIHRSGEAGYFVSNRPGQNGDDDIYLVKIRQTFMQISGNIVDDLTGKPIGGATVILYSCDGKKINNTETTWEGRFLFKALKGKCYVVGASFTNYPENRKSVGKDNKVDIRLKRNRSLELLVLDYFTRIPVKNTRVKINGIQIGQTSTDGTITKELSTEKELNADISQTGYLNQSVKVNAYEKDKVRQTILLMKIELNKPFLLDNFYFDKDSWNINPTAGIALDKLVTIMSDNPLIIIEIGSHTDSQGLDQYNLVLSQKRAESVVTYLQNKGISSERLAAKGYGETKLLNHCKNGVLCTDEEHRINTRTEFKITGFIK
jgi:outer membrane protein OmpA-like peptidoglycan-associated protein